MKQVEIILGSQNDVPRMEECFAALKKFGVSYGLSILSAHRNPHGVHDFAQRTEREGCKVIIAAAGGAAALPGVVASYTAVPVIGVPIMTSAFKGIDSLLSILQMPQGIPVATMAVGSAGAKNAALYALRILALEDAKVRKKLQNFRDKKYTDA